MENQILEFSAKFYLRKDNEYKDEIEKEVVGIDQGGQKLENPIKLTMSYEL